MAKLLYLVFSQTSCCYEIIYLDVVDIQISILGEKQITLCNMGGPGSISLRS